MNIIKHKDPFPHIIIDNFYTEIELSHIWREIEFLSYIHKLETPSKTSTAKTKDFKILKNNFGLHLDDLYKRREISNILNLNKKLFSEELIDEISSFDFSFNNFKVCNIYYTLLSYYENQGYYRPHKDLANYTALTWFYKEPKKFSKGNIYFPEYEYDIEIKNNMMLFFMSSVYHQVIGVEMENYPLDECGMFSCNGRYCMTQFCLPNYFCS